MIKFSENINNILIEEKIILALSGGEDSMVLLDILSQYKNSNIIAVTINHNLRDKSSLESIEIGKLLLNKNIKHIIINWEEGKNIKSNIEEQARDARYNLLSSYAKEHNIKYIATAHHRDDQYETFLIRLLRGSGIDGLTSMQEITNFNNNIKLIRPLLSISKEEIQIYSKENKIKFFFDESNKDTKFLRNKIRNLLNNIENKDIIDKRLLRTINHLQRARNFFDSYLQKLEKELLIMDGDNIIISLEEFKNLHQEIGLRLLINIFYKINKKTKKPRFNNLLNLYNSIINDTINKKTTFSHSIIAIKKNKIIFSPELLIKK